MTDTVNATHAAERVQAALSRYRIAVDAHTEALVARLDAKTALDTALADARYNGQIEGKNEADREAHARQLFAELYEAATEAECQVILTRADLDTAEATLAAAHTLANLAIGRGTLLETA